MKRNGLLLIFLITFLVACGSVGTDGVEEAGSEEPAQAVASVTPAPSIADPTAEPDSAEAASDTATSDPMRVRAGEQTKGASDPAVTVIEYSDFQCPGCAGLAPVLRQLVEQYPEDVQVVYRHFPLNQIHPNAQKAAEAAEAAGSQDKFWEYHDALFDGQQQWSPLDQTAARDYFVGLAGELGLDVEQFTSELDGENHAALVTQSEQEAISLGLPGTPSAIVNGQIIPGEGLPRDIETWESFVNDEIRLKELAARQYSTAPEMTIDPQARYVAQVEMASGGTFSIELLPASAPQTVNSFVFLAREGWFDGVTFHRVLPGFVAQTGDPSGTGRGGPGYMIPNEIDPELSHDEKGVVAMANAGPNTNGSQWYVTYGDVSQLDGSYTIFGKVMDGMDVVEGITPRDPSQSAGLPPGDTIARITIEEIRP